MKINKNLKIGILTYDIPHKKTRDVYFGLKKIGYKDLTILTQKFKVYKERKNKYFIKHRPEMLNKKSFSIFHDKKNIKKFNKEKINKYDYILIGGSGLINSRYIKKNKIINCHSGLIPSSRGLDSVKWDILNERIAGCTLHFIDKNIDLGKVISHKITKIKKKDNIYNFFLKHYLSEVNMLINFEKYIKRPCKLKLKKQKPNMRMDSQNEKVMLRKFKKWKKKQLKYQSI